MVCTYVCQGVGNRGLHTVRRATPALYPPFFDEEPTRSDCFCLPHTVQRVAMSCHAMPIQGITLVLERKHRQHREACPIPGAQLLPKGQVHMRVCFLS